MLLNQLDRKAFATTALSRFVRVVEFEAFIQPFFAEIQFGAFNIHEDFLINDNLDSMIFKLFVFMIQFVNELEHISHARSTRGFNPETQSYAFATVGEKVINAISSSLCNSDSHNNYLIRTSCAYNLQ